MVVGSERSDMGRQRTLRDLLSIGGIVGCVALGVAVLVTPAASNLRSIVPEGAPITAPEVTPRIGDVAVEVRPGASAQRRGSITSLSPTELVLAPFEVASETVVLASSRSVDVSTLLASAADTAVVDVGTQLPQAPAPAPLVEAPAPTGIELSAQTSDTSRPGKAKAKGKGGAKGLATAPGSSKRPATAQASSSVSSSEDDGTRGRGPKADTDQPRDHHPGRAPEHAAAHQRH